MAETKEAEPKAADKKAADKDTKDDKAQIEEKPYGEVDARWTEVRSGEVFYLLQLPPPEVEEGEEVEEGSDPVPGGYILHNAATGEEKEISHDDYLQMNLQPVPPNKRL